MNPFSLLLIILITTSFSLPRYKQTTPAQLRNNYIAALRSYEGEPYSSSLKYHGINCSTLAWQALIDAAGNDQNLLVGIKRNACKAAQIGEGCFGELTFVTDAENLNVIEYSKIQLGDVATVGYSKGLHSLIYIGNKTWIQSDPLARKVVESEAPNNELWFKLKTRVMRWNVLIDKN
jgi:hypothetical protein